MKTVKQLQDEIIAQVWSNDQPENLIVAHGQIFQEAFAEISKWVPEERERNCDVIHFCRTHYKCGMTIVTAPRGIIKRVYTVANANYCDPVFYLEKQWPAPECWARNLLVATKSDPVVPQLPLGFQPADQSTDSDFGRARTGIWAKYNGNLYVAPWLQSNEYLVIEWEGIKTEWEDDDLVNPAQDYRKAVKLYYQYGHERDYGEPGLANSIHNAQYSGTFDEALADLKWYEREKSKVQPSQFCPEERNRFPSEIADDGIPAISDISGLKLAHVGQIVESVAGSMAVELLDGLGAWHINIDVVNNSGTAFDGTRFLYQGSNGSIPGHGPLVPPGQTQSVMSSFSGVAPAAGWTLSLDGVVVYTGASALTNFHFIYTVSTPSSSTLAQLAALVIGWGPNAILGCDLIGTDLLSDTYDETVGKNFHAYLNPYSGAFGAAGDRNRFWPVLAKSDWDADATLASYLSFFTMPDPRRYYDLFLGPAHFFFIDSDSREPDGKTATSKQAIWLRDGLLRSMATWKIVVMQGNPYSSVSADTVLRWPFRNWGVDLVLSSGSRVYERLKEQNLPYIVNGLGAFEPIQSIVSADAGKQFFYNGAHGAGRLTISRSDLLYEFINIPGTVIDSLHLAK